MARETDARSRQYAWVLDGDLISMTSSEFRRTVKVIVGIDGLESSAGDRGNIGRHQLDSDSGRKANSIPTSPNGLSRGSRAQLNRTLRRQWRTLGRA